MAAAGLWTTPSDLARFLIAIQHAREGAADAVLPRELTEEMLTPQAPNISFGLGLQLEGEGDSFLFGHGGDDQGFNAWAGAYAERDLGAVVMTNSDVGWMLLGPIRDAIARAYGWPRQPPSSAETGEPRLDPDAYVGAYRTNDGGAIDIERGENGLGLVFPNQDPIELHPAGGDEWFARVVRAKVVFAWGEDGTPERLVLSQDAEYVRDVVAHRRR
jgi:hypothetical protein